MKKFKKTSSILFKSSRQSLIKANEFGVIAKQLATLLIR